MTDFGPSPPIPAALQGPGNITRRQTTFWEVETRTGARCRIHFRQKLEARMSVKGYQSLEFTSEHPLLNHYEEAWQRLYVASAVEQPGVLATRIYRMVLISTDGWRDGAEYVNPVATEVLRDGHGQLLEAPASLADRARSMLAELGVRTSILEHRAPPDAPPSVLRLAPSAVILAREFRFEER